MSENATEPRKPGRLARVLTPVIVLLVTLGLVELVLQVAAPLPYSSRLYWLSDGHIKARLDPDQSIVNVDGNPVEVNSLGFRGPEPSPTPAPGTLRVLALGGSSTFCYDVSDDAHTWPALLEAKLTEALGMPVEVVNLGLPGFDTSNSKVNYLFTGRALHPHAIVVYHTWNDMKFLRLVDESEMVPRDALSGRRSTGTNLSPLSRFFWHSQIVQRGRLVYIRFRNEARENSYLSLEGQGRDADAPVGNRGWDWFAQNFRDVVRFARADGVVPVLVSQATLAQDDALENQDYRLVIQNTYQGMTMPRLVSSWREANAVIEGVARSEGAIFVDGYGAVPDDFEHFKDHVHLRDPGSELLAAAIAETLAQDPSFLAAAERARSPEAEGAPTLPAVDPAPAGVDPAPAAAEPDAGAPEEGQAPR